MGRGRGRQAEHNRNRYRAGGHLMFSLYVVLKFIHILSAITAVGANITYGLWDSRSQADPAHLRVTLHGINVLDDRIANPASRGLLLTGLLMVFRKPRPLPSPRRII